MRLLFAYLALCLILFSCKKVKPNENLVQEKESDPPQIENTLPQKKRSAFDVMVDSINGLYPPRSKADFTRMDKYGNSYDWDSRLMGFHCEIKHFPDLEVIMVLRNHIYEISIYTGKGYSASITDISFLEHLPQLRKLYISGSKEIETLEALKYLVSLEELYIGDGYQGIFDCSMLSNLKNLKSLKLAVDNIANKETIFSLPNLEEIWLNNYFKGMGGNYYEEYKTSPVYKYESGKYHILQYRANIRTEPSRDSDVLALLHLHDEIEILENSWIAEKINDVWGLWYKIKYGDIIGYTFGGNIAISTLITDMDKNGIKDYFYYRYSSAWKFNPETDIIIYINNQRIDTSALGEYEWMGASFEDKDDHVLVELMEEGGDTGGWEIYKVTSNGKIIHLTNRRDY